MTRAGYEFILEELEVNRRRLHHTLHTAVRNGFVTLPPNVQLYLDASNESLKRLHDAPTVDELTD